MKKLVIGIFVKNANYEKALLRGLCMECTGLDVYSIKDRETAEKSLTEGVVLTDYEGFPQENRIDKLGSVRDVLEQAIKVNYSKTGEMFNPNPSKTLTIGFYSNYGGLGTTSIAITYSRFLAMKTNKKVLYLNLSLVDDYYKYINLSNKDIYNKKQYIYMCSNKYHIDYRKYFFKDQWGVLYFRPEKTYNFFVKELSSEYVLDVIKSQEYFDYLVVDLGKRPENLEEDSKEFHVLYKVTNATENGEGTDIPTDTNSFEPVDKNIEISMLGSFAKTVESMITGDMLCILECPDAKA